MRTPNLDHVVTVGGVSYRVAVSADHRTARVSPDLPADEDARLAVLGAIVDAMGTRDAVASGAQPDGIEIIPVRDVP